MAQHELCTKIFEAKWENREQISKRLREMYPDNDYDHDKWLSLVNEVEDRINWNTHLEYHSWCAYINNGCFKPEEVKWTLEDYVYDH